MREFLLAVSADAVRSLHGRQPRRLDLDQVGEEVDARWRDLLPLELAVHIVSVTKVGQPRFEMLAPIALQPHAAQNHEAAALAGVRAAHEEHRPGNSVQSWASAGRPVQ